MLFRTHFKRLFDVTLIIKGIAAILDIIAAVAIFTTGSSIVVRFFAKVTTFATHFENDNFVGSFFSHQASSLTQSDIWFIAGYFAIHGIVNIIIVEGIWFRRQWAYTKAMRILLFFFFSLGDMAVVLLLTLLLLGGGPAVGGAGRSSSKLMSFIILCARRVCVVLHFLRATKWFRF